MLPKKIEKILESSKDIKINIVSPNFDQEAKLIFARETNVKFLKENLDFLILETLI